MSNYSIKFEEEKGEPELWPKRVQTLIDSYKQASKKLQKSMGGGSRNTHNRNFKIDYIPETLDYLEKIFEDRVREKPESLKVNITAIYRVRTQAAQEFYYYAAVKTCVNTLGQLAEPFSYEQYGFHKRPIVSMAWNEASASNEPRVAGYEPVYEFPWQKDEVRKLLDSSAIPCQHFYIGRTGNSASDPIEVHRYQIFNKEDFLEGSFDDLIDLGRLGISYPEKSLHLVGPARQQERENREKAVGINNPKVYIQ